MRRILCMIVLAFAQANFGFVKMTACASYIGTVSLIWEDYLWLWKNARAAN